jgi:hypothetical protein
MKSWFARYGLAILVSLWGAGFIALGAGRLYLDRLYVQEGQHAAGRVTFATTHGTMNPVSSSVIQYQFATASGASLSGRQEGYSGRVGEVLDIEYLRSSPGWNRIAGAARRYQRWNLPTIVGGLLFLIAGIYATVRAWITAQRHED